MAKFCFFIIAVTLVTVAYGSLPIARKFVVPIKATRPFEFPECVRRPCRVPTQDVDCYEVGCRCDEVTNLCRDRKCSDRGCESSVDCPLECDCNEALHSCYEKGAQPKPVGESQGKGQNEPEEEVCRGGEPCEDTINHDCVGVCTCEEFEYENRDVGLECVRPLGYESSEGESEPEVEVCRGGEFCEDPINHDCVGDCTCEEFEYENGDVGLECVRPLGYESGSESGSEFESGYESGSEN